LNHPGDYAVLFVSPQDNRYSMQNINKNNSLFFDSEAVLVADVLDFENGIVGGPVKMNLSFDNGANYGYPGEDIFPLIELEKIFELNSPLNEVLISPDSKVNFSLNVQNSCSLYIGKEKVDFENELYENLYYFNEGKNEINVKIDCPQKEIVKSASKFEGKEISLVNKEIYYLGNEEYLISFSGKKGKEIFSIFDYVPNEFYIYDVSNGGKFAKDSFGAYNYIEWKNVYGSSFNFSYKIRPKEWLKNCEYKVENQEGILRDFKGSLIDKNFLFNCNFSKDVSFYLLKNVNIEKDFNDKIKNGEKENIFLTLNLSHEVSGVEFKEYVPIEFRISDISSGGKIYHSSSNYDVIVWNISGKEINLNYSISSKYSGEYPIISEIGGTFLEENKIKVYSYVPPVFSGGTNSGSSSGSKKSNSNSFGKSRGNYKFVPENYSIISNDLPIIRKKDNLTIALYSQNFSSGGALEVLDLDFNERVLNRSLEYLEGYLFETNLWDNFGKVIFEYQYNNSELEKKGFRNLELKGKDSQGNWITLTGNVVSLGEGNNKIIFENSSSFRQIAVFGIKEKLSIWDKIIEWIQNLFQFKTGVI
jgi:hypothetical protein